MLIPSDISVEFHVLVYPDNAVKGHFINKESVCSFFNKIYARNNLPQIRLDFIDKIPGSSNSDANKEQLQADTFLIKLTKDYNLQPGEYIHGGISYVNIASFLLLNKSDEFAQKKPDLNYQVGYTIAHETLHHLLNEVECFYDVQGMNVFNLTTIGPRGYTGHAICGWNLLQPGKLANGHNNPMGIPISAKNAVAEKMEQILPEHIEAIQNCLYNKSLPADTQIYFEHRNNIREQLILLKRRQPICTSFQKIQPCLKRG